ncbi:MAG TPA: FecR domain-containing protein [Chitinophaga sp.]
MCADEDYKRSLLRLYLENSCTPEQLEEVMEWLRNNDADRVLLAQMKEDFVSSLNASPPAMNEEQSIRLRKEILQRISPVPVIRIRSQRWMMVAAAAILAILFSGIFYYTIPRKTRGFVAASGSHKAAEIGPAVNKAVLTLADGSTVTLDDAHNGTLAQQGNTQIVQLGAKLNYKNAGNTGGMLMYNTIVTPRGSQYQLELPDGTKVWLNASSSLKFPTAFNGDERRVEITGEGYFEVAAVKMKNGRKKSFIVKAGSAEVKVLGTHFNIMAYQDEPLAKTTLLEGAVRVVNGKDSVLLSPGQQSQLTKEGNIRVVSNVNTGEDLAWMNGYFLFEDADIGTIMRQLSRWYDVDVVYLYKTNERFNAQPSRSAKLSNVLKALEMTGKIHFTVEGKTIKVMP